MNIDNIMTMPEIDTIDEAKGIYTEVVLKQLELGADSKKAIKTAVDVSTNFITTFQTLEGFSIK